MAQHKRVGKEMEVVVVDPVQQAIAIASRARAEAVVATQQKIQRTAKAKTECAWACAAADLEYAQTVAELERAKAEAASKRKRAKDAAMLAAMQIEVAAAAAARPAEQRDAAARAARARVFSERDPDDLPCFPEATRVNGGRCFPWEIALQFAAARDLVVLARTHHAANIVCQHKTTYERVISARYRGGCSAKEEHHCKCDGCARVALLLRATKGFPGDDAGAGAGAGNGGGDPRAASGADVEAMAANGKWWPVVVTRARADGSFDVDVRDGTGRTKWMRMPSRNVRLLAASRAVKKAKTEARSSLQRLHRIDAVTAAGLARDNGGGTVQITSATGSGPTIVNGIYDLMGGGERPVFLKRGSFSTHEAADDEAIWLYVNWERKWTIGPTTGKNKRNMRYSDTTYQYWSVYAFNDREAAAAIEGAPPLPHQAAGAWRQGRADMPISVRTITRGDVDRLEAAAAATWDAATARGPPAVKISGASGRKALRINGTYDCEPGERILGDAPVYKRRWQAGGTRSQTWLFFTCDTNTWVVADTNGLIARRYQSRTSSGWARSGTFAADGTLPHETPTKGWTLGIDVTPEVGRTEEEKAEADRLEADAKSKLAAVWDAAAARAPAIVTIRGTNGEDDIDVGDITGVFDCVPEERHVGGAPVYKRRGLAYTEDLELWLFYTHDNTWQVSDIRAKDRREDVAGDRWDLTRTVSTVAEGTLPHEVPAGQWEAWLHELDDWGEIIDYGGWITQAAQVVVAGEQDDFPGRFYGNPSSLIRTHAMNSYANDPCVRCSDGWVHHG